MYSNELVKELGLIELKLKQPAPSAQAPKTETAKPEQPTKANSQLDAELKKQSQQAPAINKPVAPPKMDKNEFRLLVKMLKAIGHDCVFDAIDYDGQAVKYSLSEVTLIFDDIYTADTATCIHLASLHDILADSTLKRPVWEKLKVLKV